MYEQYKHRAAFYIVYIKEAHPIDLWQIRSNQRDKVLLYAPRTESARFENASQCVRNLGVRIPALIDNMQDAAENAYTGWPDRLYVIAPGGRIAYKSAPGPYGFLPKSMETSLLLVLGSKPLNTARLAVRTSGR